MRTSKRLSKYAGPLQELSGYKVLQYKLPPGQEEGSSTISSSSLTYECPLDILIADVINSQDYYPFGSIMPGRNYQGSDGYRYGFNGMEADDEVKGNDNSLDFGARIYDPRIGKWLSSDPKESKYPGLSPYQFAANIPTLLVDHAGEDFRYKVDKENHTITIETTIHVYGPNANQNIVDDMNNDFAALNDQGVYYDENGVEYKVTINANG
ncbi:MAG: RHS repeat-associated core domain-containing protein [Owenweeksia sp.]|nr:RHS repeat-associated core domain-containing protein [Owenweeksia sp.]